MLELKYPSQRLAYPFFVTMLIFFLLQITYGLMIALQQVDPYFLQGILNFNVNRSTHVNLAIIWILTGLVGALLFVGPILAKRDLARPWLARVLLIALWAVVLVTAVTLVLAQSGIAGWAYGQPWLQEGLEFLEAGRLADVFLWIGFVILGYLILRIFPNIRQWNSLHWGLAIGLAGLATFWLFGMFFVPTLDLGEFFRWFVVHYWVEGVWEILYVSIVGFLLYTLFDADLKVVGFVVFWSVLLVVMTGLIGNGHHFFWIGTPAFWQFWGSLISALEPLPIILGIWHVFLHPKRSHKPLANRAAFYFIFGSALLELVGAGILGFTQTFSLTNVWEHGTWVTPAHAHLALFGTFGMLVLGAAYVVVPAIRGIRRFDDRLSRAAFWLLLVGILGMMLSFALGGTIQVYIYRVLGIEWFGPVVRPAMEFWRGLLFVFGSLFAAGVIAVSYDLFTLKRRAEAAKPAAVAHEREGFAWWRRPLSVAEMGGWLGALWFIGFLLTGGLLANNLPSVRLGDPTLPYLLASIGYPALVLVTLALAIRFLRACEAQPSSAAD
ncbi:MAG TPA: cbb3-type cytochrome c oxidase subunit I [Anaerolineae bacterium]|nr:cbb3-type cytochrome c oxidase subunit I [Anaerolineae bacterium]